MPISGEKRPEFARKVGAFIGEVVAINPTAAQIQEMYKLDEPPKDPEYLGAKDTDVPDRIEDGQVIKMTKNIKSCRIDIYVEDTKTQQITKKALFLFDRPFVKKDLTKQQFINEQGKTTWIDDLANLPEKFTHILDKKGHPMSTMEYHPTIVGESDLVDFLGVWLNINRSKPFQLSIDTEPLFKGNFAQLQSLINSDLAQLIMSIYTVRSVDGESGPMFYQDMWKKFLPAYAHKFFVSNEFTPERLKSIQDKQIALKAKISSKTVEKDDWLENWEKYVLEITDEENGCADFFDLLPAHDFDPDKHFATKAATIDPAGAEY